MWFALHFVFLILVLRVELGTPLRKKQNLLYLPALLHLWLAFGETTHTRWLHPYRIDCYLINVFFCSIASWRVLDRRTGSTHPVLKSTVVLPTQHRPHQTINAMPALSCLFSPRANCYKRRDCLGAQLYSVYPLRKAHSCQGYKYISITLPPLAASLLLTIDMIVAQRAISNKTGNKPRSPTGYEPRLRAAPQKPDKEQGITFSLQRADNIVCTASPWFGERVLLPCVTPVQTAPTISHQ